MSCSPWQKAEVPGTKRGIPLQRPEVLSALLNKSKRPILIVGHKSVEMDLKGKKLIDYLINLAKTGKIPIVATAHIIKEFSTRGFDNATSMPVMDVANRLRDPDWKGLDGLGPYDLVLFAGLPYYMEWLVLSGLKDSKSFKTISINGFFQPNASWSIPNISSSKLEDFLDDLIRKLGEN